MANLQLFQPAFLSLGYDRRRHVANLLYHREMFLRQKKTFPAFGKISVNIKQTVSYARKIE
jgi:hypothetical protein